MSDRIGRVLLSSMFVVGGLDSLVSPGARVKLVADAGLPRADLLTRANGLLLVAGSVALACDIKHPVGPALLTASVVPMTFVGHRFWVKEGEARKADVMGFARNVSLLGGLLLSARRPSPRALEPQFAGDKTYRGTSGD